MSASKTFASTISQNKELIIVTTIIVGGFIVYKMLKAPFVAVGAAIDSGADVIGMGSVADKTTEVINRSKRAANSPFNYQWLSNFAKKNPKVKYKLLTVATKKSLFDKVTKLLSRLYDFTHPFQFDAHRKQVSDLLINYLKTKSQVADLNLYFLRKTNKGLLETLDEGFREKSLTTGKELQNSLASLVEYMNSLPDATL